MADTKRVKSPQDFMSSFSRSSSSSSSSTSLFLQSTSSWVVFQPYASLSYLFVRYHSHYPSCRPSPRRQLHPLSELSCSCKTRMRWCVVCTVLSIQLTWLSDQARSSCQAIQGCCRRFLSHLQGRGSCLAMAWKHRKRDPLFPYAGFELCLQYGYSLSIILRI